MIRTRVSLGFIRVEHMLKVKWGRTGKQVTAGKQDVHLFKSGLMSEEWDGKGEITNHLLLNKCMQCEYTYTWVIVMPQGPWKITRSQGAFFLLLQKKSVKEKMGASRPIHTWWNTTTALCMLLSEQWSYTMNGLALSSPVLWLCCNCLSSFPSS